MQSVKLISVAAIGAFATTVFTGLLVIPLLKKLKAGQPVLKYVSEHKAKNGTPTMGGLFFIPSAGLCFSCAAGLKERLPPLP